MFARILSLILAAWLAALSLAAESYVVYAVHGPVFELDKGQRTPITPRATHLTANSLISIAKGGSLTVYMGESRRLATIDEIGSQRLSTLISRSRKTDGAAADWAVALVNSLMKSDTPESTHRRILQSQGGSHRGDDDDSALANTIAAYLSGQMPETQSLLAVHFVDADGSPIAGDILGWPDEAVARITNGSDDYLFVNLLAVEPDGSRSLIFPIDTDIENNCCAHLLVPPHSVVAFTELPFFSSFLDAGTRILAVGAPMQVNFSALCRREPYDPAMPLLPLVIAPAE